MTLFIRQLCAHMWGKYYSATPYISKYMENKNIT